MEWNGHKPKIPLEVLKTPREGRRSRLGRFFSERQVIEMLVGEYAFIWRVPRARGVKRSGAHDSQVERVLACCPFGAHGAQINLKKV